MTKAYIGIGSNLGNRRRNIEQALELLRQADSIEVIKTSSIYETDPVAGPEQGKFLNGAVEIETNLSPQQLLAELNRIENQLGRKRTVRFGARTIDLDILLYGDLTVNEPNLEIPHPRMKEREFVLRGLSEIADNQIP